MKKPFALLALAAALTFWTTASLLAADQPVPLTNAPSALHNVFRVTPRVLSGSQPEGDAAFAWLASQGVKTIVSVDGARPDVEAARRHGLRYVHLPVGYDGVPTNRLAELATVANRMPGPFYVHCHHGKHRGPAAAALMCEASENWSAAEADAFLKQAGTSADYPGLYRSVREFRPPDAKTLAALANALPEAAATTSLVQAMVAMDEHLERLRSCQQAHWGPPPGQPDVSPAHEALMLSEQLRELQRLDDVKRRPTDFAELLIGSEQAADDLRRQWSDSRGPGGEAANGLNTAFARVVQSCAACHEKCRNN